MLTITRQVVLSATSETEPRTGREIAALLGLTQSYSVDIVSATLHQMQTQRKYGYRTVKTQDYPRRWTKVKL